MGPVIMETKKSHALPSASRRPSELVVHCQSRAEGLRGQEPMVYIPVQVQENIDVLAQKQLGIKQFSLITSFYSIQASNWLDEAHPH